MVLVAVLNVKEMSTIVLGGGLNSLTAFLVGVYFRKHIWAGEIVSTVISTSGFFFFCVFKRVSKGIVVGLIFNKPAIQA